MNCVPKPRRPVRPEPVMEGEVTFKARGRAIAITFDVAEINTR